MSNEKWCRKNVSVVNFKTKISLSSLFIPVLLVEEVSDRTIGRTYFLVHYLILLFVELDTSQLLVALSSVFVKDLLASLFFDWTCR
jgi:hypothetical protein